MIKDEEMTAVEEIRRMLVKHPLKGRSWGFALTLKTNSRLPLYEGQKLLRGFHARLDCAILGSRWAKKPASERTSFILIPEYGVANGDLHWHGVVDFAVAKYSNAQALELIDECWHKMTARGSTHYPEIFDPKGWADYCITEKSMNDNGRKITRHIYEYITSEMFIAKTHG